MRIPDQPASSVSEIGTESGGPRMIRLPDGSYTTKVPGSKGVDQYGRTGTYVLNKASGTMSFAPDRGGFEFSPETNAVEWRKAAPSFMEKITAGGALDRSSVGPTGEAPSFWDKATAGGKLDPNAPSAPTSALQPCSSCWKPQLVGRCTR